MSRKGLFWKPGEKAPGLQIEREDSGAEMEAPKYNPYDKMSISQQRARLPVYKHRTEILYLLEKHNTLVIVGETGCGKSTQIPQYLHEAGWTAHNKTVAILQPRRVAAVSVAQRVAEEMGCAPGSTVGYAIRFDHCYTPEHTRLLFMTEGELIMQMMRDPLLSHLSVVMLDEAHERTIFMDVVVGLLYKIQKRRKDLRIIVSSATLDADAFRDFFNTNPSSDPAKDTAAILSLEGRTYPVDVFYAEAPVADYLQATVDTVLDIHRKEEAGDILAFLTGQDEIDKVVDKLREGTQGMAGRGREISVLPLYGGLPAADQMRIFEQLPSGVRKVIVATNIAEASVTIPGIVYVVDCGFVKIKAYNPDTTIESLVVAPVSRASADQRAGRAGRIRPGKAFRLFTEDAFAALPAATVPEMLRTELSPVLVQLKALGVDNVLRFPFLSPPPAKAMSNALTHLYALGALDADSRLTELGLRVAEVPVHPMMAKMLLDSGEHECSEEMVTIAAMLQVRNVFVTPRNQRKDAQRARLLFTAEEGDHITLLNAFNAFVRHGSDSKWCQKRLLNFKGLVRAAEIRIQLVRFLRRYGVKIVSADGDVASIVKCIASGYFAQAARMYMDGNYYLLTDHERKTPLSIHPTSVYYATVKAPEYIIYQECVLTDKPYLRDVTAVSPRVLAEVAPVYYKPPVNMALPETKKSRP